MPLAALYTLDPKFPFRITRKSSFKFSQVMVLPSEVSRYPAIAMLWCRQQIEQKHRVVIVGAYKKMCCCFLLLLVPTQRCVIIGGAYTKMCCYCWCLHKDVLLLLVPTQRCVLIVVHTQRCVGIVVHTQRWAIIVGAYTKMCSYCWCLHKDVLLLLVPTQRCLVIVVAYNAAMASSLRKKSVVFRTGTWSTQITITSKI